MSKPKYKKLKRSPAINLALDSGFSLYVGRHAKLSKGPHTIFAPLTASDWRSEKNVMAKVRRCLRGECDCAGVLYRS